jgi:hypothetical protein
MSLGAWPSSHLSAQKLTLLPLPTLMLIQVRNNCISVSELGMSRPVYGLPSICHACHCHRRRKAFLNLLRSTIPKPPSHFGINTLFQFTMQWPPVAVAVPHHKKARQILSILCMAHLLSWNTVIWWMTTEESTELIKVSLPAVFRSLPFHRGSFAATLSMRICSSSLRILPVHNGRPRY